MRKDKLATYVSINAFPYLNLCLNVHTFKLLYAHNGMHKLKLKILVLLMGYETAKLHVMGMSCQFYALVSSLELDAH